MANPEPPEPPAFLDYARGDDSTPATLGDLRSLFLWIETVCTGIESTLADDQHRSLLEIKADWTAHAERGFKRAEEDVINRIAMLWNDVQGLVEGTSATPSGDPVGEAEEEDHFDALAGGTAIDDSEASVKGPKSVSVQVPKLTKEKGRDLKPRQPGDPIKSTVRLPASLHTQLKHLGTDSNQKLQGLLIDAIKHYLEPREALTAAINKARDRVRSQYASEKPVMTTVSIPDEIHAQLMHRGTDTGMTLLSQLQEAVELYLGAKGRL